MSKHGRGSVLIVLAMFQSLMALPADAQGKKTNAVIRAESLALETLLDERGNIWMISPDELMEKNKKYGFEWSDEARSSARAYKLKNHSFFGIPVVETVIHLQGAAVAEIVMFLYNRGDQDSMAQYEFELLLRDAGQAISDWSGARPKSVSDRQKDTRIERKRMVWNKLPHQVCLETSVSTGSRARGSGMRPEYVRVRCLRYDPKTDMASTAIRDRAEQQSKLSLRDVKQNVHREDSGDVRIDGVPMVDQGEKGYCAVAAAERVLRYYGRDVDQHQLAQLASTEKWGGTSGDSMLTALRKIGALTGCKLTIIDDLTFSDVRRTIEKYNKLAESEGRRTIYIGNVTSLTGLYSGMDPELLRKVRLEHKPGHRKFVEKTREYVNKGAPLCWAVMLGVVKEEQLSRQARGGHIRLIIGYNDKTGEVLYSDTWGKGHELKRMNIDDAWAISTGLYVVQPGR